MHACARVCLPGAPNPQSIQSTRWVSHLPVSSSMPERPSVPTLCLPRPNLHLACMLIALAVTIPFRHDCLVLLHLLRFCAARVPHHRRRRRRLVNHFFFDCRLGHRLPPCPAVTDLVRPVLGAKRARQPHRWSPAAHRYAGRDLSIESLIDISPQKNGTERRAADTGTVLWGWQEGRGHLGHLMAQGRDLARQIAMWVLAANPKRSCG